MGSKTSPLRRPYFRLVLGDTNWKTLREHGFTIEFEAPRTRVKKGGGIYGQYLSRIFWGWESENLEKKGGSEIERDTHTRIFIG